MKKTMTLIALSLFYMNGLQAQTKPSIAVVNSSVTEVDLKPATGAKLVRLELVKLGRYTVLDEFDMAEVYHPESEYYTNCNGLTCLANLGEKLGVTYMVSSSYDLLGGKIVISVKMIDVATRSVYNSSIREFDDQNTELQRMTEIVIKEMHGEVASKEVAEQLSFKNEPITSKNVGRINNSGPRVGVAALTGNLYEYATRSEEQGGLDIFPMVSMIGYQLEAQYVGTENFSALVEGVFNISGLEQGMFIPSITLMNGFRFGKAGWEFAFGPGFNLSTTSKGFFDTEGKLSDDKAYWSASDWNNYVNEELNDELAHPEYFTEGYFKAPEIGDIHESYNFSKDHLDKRGKVKLGTSFVFAFGRTFRAGSLNIPVNVFYSSRKGGGYAGLSVGFNVIRKKEPMHKSKA